MIKKTVKYVDFDENPVEETLYFHVTKRDLFENHDVFGKDEAAINELVKEIQNDESGRKLFNVLDRLIQMSYGVKSDDGKRFVKSKEQTMEFMQSAAYDALFSDFLENANSAVDFIVGVLPSDLKVQAEAEAKARYEKLMNATPVEREN